MYSLEFVNALAAQYMGGKPYKVEAVVLPLSKVTEGDPSTENADFSKLYVGLINGQFTSINSFEAFIGNFEVQTSSQTIAGTNSGGTIGDISFETPAYGIATVFNFIWIGGEPAPLGFVFIGYRLTPLA